jgi:hypothetical protein
LEEFQHQVQSDFLYGQISYSDRPAIRRMRSGTFADAGGVSIRALTGASTCDFQMIASASKKGRLRSRPFG